MTGVKKINEVFKCNICGNIVEVLYVGGAELICCGQPMELQIEKTITEEGREKHVPIIEDTEDGQTLVKIGSEPHPMDENHYIQWVEIDLHGENKICRKNLKPGEKPEAKFRAKVSEISARAYCNIHKLWKS